VHVLVRAGTHHQIISHPRHPALPRLTASRNRPQQPGQDTHDAPRATPLSGHSAMRRQMLARTGRSTQRQPRQPNYEPGPSCTPPLPRQPPAPPTQLWTECRIKPYINQERRQRRA
jgi:hypothetical protein